jgi:hypothetical protein
LAVITLVPSVLFDEAIAVMVRKTPYEVTTEDHPVDD